MNSQLPPTEPDHYRLALGALTMADRIPAIEVDTEKQTHAIMAVAHAILALRETLLASWPT